VADETSPAADDGGSSVLQTYITHIAIIIIIIISHSTLQVIILLSLPISHYNTAAVVLQFHLHPNVRAPHTFAHTHAAPVGRTTISCNSNINCWRFSRKTFGSSALRSSVRETYHHYRRYRMQNITIVFSCRP